MDRVSQPQSSKKERSSRVYLGDSSKGYFIQPTVIVTKNPKSITMTQEIFGPVITVSTSSPHR